MSLIYKENSAWLQRRRGIHRKTGSKPSSTYKRVELLGDSHYKVETRPRDLNTVVTSRIK